MRNFSLIVFLQLLNIGVLHVLALNEKPCGVPPTYDYAQPDQKYIRMQKYSDGEKVRYSCAADYVPTKGHLFVECINGDWSTLTLKCEKKSCGDAGVLPNGFFEYSGVSIGDRVQAVCNNGYKLKGEGSLVCKESGWSPNNPTCEEEQTICPSPYVANGVKTSKDVPAYRAGDSVKFMCSQGFKLIGHQHVTCGSTGQWDPKLPECLPAHGHTCVANINNAKGIINPKAVYKSGETLSYSCEGISNAQLTSATCGPNGTWQPPLVKCKRIKCPELIVLKATLSSRHRRVNSVIQVRCNGGYELQGSAEVVCSENGNWNSIPKCVPVGHCDVPNYVPHAHLQYTYNQKNSFSSGERVRYECDVGYVRAGGSSYRFCENGKWTRALLHCERRLCGSAGEIFNGAYTYTGASFGDTATAVCEKGYQLFGKSVRTCTNGGWDGNPPVCEVVYCLAPPEVPNAYTSETEVHYKYGSGLSYGCRFGRLIGNREIFCMEDGTWSGDPPQCRGY